MKINPKFWIAILYFIPLLLIIPAIKYGLPTDNLIFFISWTVCVVVAVFLYYSKIIPRKLVISLVLLLFAFMMIMWGLGIHSKSTLVELKPSLSKQYEDINFRISVDPYLGEEIIFTSKWDYNVESKQAKLNLVTISDKANLIENVTVEMPDVLNKGDVIIRNSTKDNFIRGVDFIEVDKNIDSSHTKKVDILLNKKLDNGSTIIVTFNGDLIPQGEFHIMSTPSSKGQHYGTFFTINLGKNYICEHPCFYNYENRLSWNKWEVGNYWAIMPKENHDNFSYGHEVFRLNLIDGKKLENKENDRALGLAMVISGFTLLIYSFLEWLDTTLRALRRKKFLIIKNGKTYHTKDCYHIKNTPNKNTINIEEYRARKKGIKPCKKCNPKIFP